MNFSELRAKWVGLVFCAALAGCLGPGLTPPKDRSAPGVVPNQMGTAGTTSAPVGGTAMAGSAGSAASVTGNAGASNPGSLVPGSDAGRLNESDDAGSDEDAGVTGQR
jgi:hypothetical protein